MKVRCSIKHSSAAEYLKLAIEDEGAATILRAGGAPNRVVGFSCQQAVEKLLKAALIHLGIEPPFRHPIGPLLRQLEAAGETLPASFADLDKLDPYAVAYRYSGTPLGIGFDMDVALQLASEVRAWVEQKIV